MGLTQAIIVAAGQGRRLRPLTACPKAMLEIGGTSLIRRSLEYLHRTGISEIAVVVGYRREMLMEHLKEFTIRYFFNPLYAITNNMTSLWFAHPFVRDDFIYLHGDLIYDERLLHMLLHSQNPNSLLVERKPCDDEAMKVQTNDTQLVVSSKEIPPEEAFGEWTGLAKFDVTLGRILFDRIGELVESGEYAAYDTLAFTELAKQGYTIGITAFEDLTWVEIDTQEDLVEARRLFGAE